MRVPLCGGSCRLRSYVWRRARTTRCPERSDKSPPGVKRHPPHERGWYRDIPLQAVLEVISRRVGAAAAARRLGQGAKSHERGRR